MSIPKSRACLPEGYTAVRQIDLQKNKKEMLLVNGLAAAIAVVLAIIGALIVPILSIFEGINALGYLLRLLVFVIGMFGYVVLHEAVHGIFMKGFCPEVKPTFGLSLMYAYAGSEAFYNRRDYIIIALAPVVIWGVVLAIITPLVPQSWFWVVYFIQIMNLSGAAGDFYVTKIMLSMPSSILVQDSGTAMVIYGKAE